MLKLSNLLKENKIDLSIAVYPWPGTLNHYVKNNKQVRLWSSFCEFNCKKFYNLMNPFFDMLDKEDFKSLYQKIYIKNDIHFNEKGNEIIE